MSYWVMNLGCKVNRVESDSISSSLSYVDAEAPSLEEADIVIINTCTVTSLAEKKTRKAVRRALTVSGASYVIVTGCAVSIDPETYMALDGRIVVEADKSKVPGIVGRLLDGDRGIRRQTFPSALRVGDAFPTRVGIKVQDGCDNACTYCIVHVARGKAYSRAFEDIIDEACAYEKAGVREMVLTGINLGSYDQGGFSLSDLLESLVNSTESARFRISSIEPCDIDRNLISVMERSHGRICRHLHLPLQSGSPAILEAMARPYDDVFFRNLVDRLYTAIPSLSLSTDIIVGFPGETEEDFERTLALAAYCRFSKIHVFRYSPRKGTPAASMPDQVPPEVKARRAGRVADLAKTMREDDLARRRGCTETVLVEPGKRAMTESYHLIDVGGSEIPGTLMEATL